MPPYNSPLALMTEFRSPQVLPPIPDNLTIPQFFLDTVSPIRPRRPDTAPWLIEDGTGRGLGHSEVLARTNALANGLSLKWKLSEDDVVSLLCPNHIDYPICIWAIHRLGCIASPANPALTVEELTYHLQITKAAGILVYSDCYSIAVSAAEAVGISKDRIALIQGSSPPKGLFTVQDLVEFGSTSKQAYSEPRLRPGEAKTKIAFLSFSSGTTGKPKAVAIPHISTIANVLQMAIHWRIDDPQCKYRRMPPGGIAAGVLPFFHIYGLVVTLHFVLFAGMSVLVVPKFNFQNFIKSIVRHRVTHLFLVPPQVLLFCKHLGNTQFDTSRVTYIMSGAAPLSGELLLEIAKIFPNASIGQGYGMTETCTTVSTLAPDRQIATVGSAGVLLPGVTARVIKADGRIVGEGEQGELVVKAPSNALRYLNNEQASRDTFVDGWVRTGDEVIIRDGEVHIVDRLKEIMKVRGFQVAPAELEGHLLLHPAVADVCVIGVPDDYSGELPFAYVVLSANVKASRMPVERIKDELSKHISASKVNYKWIDPNRIAFIDAIPKSPSGKILRRQLRGKVKQVQVAKL